MNEVSTSRPTAIFPKAKSLGPRDWGEEILLVHAPGLYTLKKLILKAGKKGGLQYHRKKDEATYILSGTLLVRYEDKDSNLIEKILEKGDFLHFPTGCIHQEEAISDVVMIEVSTPFFNDRVRVESLFGQDIANYGLPSTTEDEIIEG